MKKIKPTIGKSTISSLKFQRKSDFNKLLKFVEKETKELKNIKIPKRSQIKSKKKGMNLFGLGLLGLVGILGAGFGGGEDEKEVKEEKFGIDKFMIGRVQKDKKGDDSLKKLKDLGTSTKIATGGGVKFDLFNKNPFKNIKFGSAANATTLESGTYRYRTKAKYTQTTTTTTSEIGGDSTKKTTTITKDDIRGSKGTDQRRKAQQFGKNQVDKVSEIFMDIDGKMVDSYDKLSVQGKKAHMIRKQLDDPSRKLSKSKRDRLIEELDMLERNPVPTTKVKPNIFNRLSKKFMNFYNKGRNVRFPNENNAKLIDLIKDDFSQVTYSDSAFKSGKKGFFNLRPLKAFLDPKMRATGPTPLTRQLIERPFRSLSRVGSSVTKFGSNILKSVNKDFAKGLFKSKTKTGLFLVDLFFVGQSFYDLFLRPGDNVFTAVQDFFIAINNAVYRNDPEKLKYFVTRSKSSAPLFGVTNQMIREKEINRNLKIKELKEAAATTSITGGNSNNQNTVVVPQTNNNSKRGSGVRNKTTGGKKASFVPMDLKNPLASQIEYKLSK
tara:strand:+ start:1531 stop:3183 length:1653 start_codon:yes stop_codon:yes gene_type:complete